MDDMNSFRYNKFWSRWCNLQGCSDTRSRVVLQSTKASAGQIISTYTSTKYPHMHCVGLPEDLSIFENFPYLCSILSGSRPSPMSLSSAEGSEVSAPRAEPQDQRKCAYPGNSQTLISMTAGLRPLHLSSALFTFSPWDMFVFILYVRPSLFRFRFAPY